MNNSPVKTENVCTHILSIFVAWVIVSIALMNVPLSTVNACDLYYNLDNDPQQSAQPSMPSISAGFTADRELKAGDAHSYKLNLASGQFLHVVVEQKGIDVVVRLFLPDGKKLIEV